MSQDCSELICVFEMHLAHLIEQCNALPAKPVHEPLFDTYLFKPLAPSSSLTFLLTQYINEIKRNIDYLHEKKESIQSETIVYLTEKIANQLVALSREMATQSLRLPSYEKTEETHYETHCRYLSYEKRLIEMKRYFQSELDGAKAASQKAHWSQQLATVEGRLFRCRQALARLEDSTISDAVTYR